MTDYTDVIDHTIETMATTIKHATSNPTPLQRKLTDELTRLLTSSGLDIAKIVARELENKAGLKQHLADSAVDPNVITAAYAAEHIYDRIEVILEFWNHETADWDADERDLVASVIFCVSYELGKLQGELRGRSGCRCSDCLPF